MADSEGTDSPVVNKVVFKSTDGGGHMWEWDVSTHPWVRKRLTALDKAVEALDRLSRLGNEPNVGNSIGNHIAEQALNEILAAIQEPQQQEPKQETPSG